MSRLAVFDVASHRVSESIAVGIPHAAARVAAARCSILISGETGTGKGHLARWMHQHSPRASRPFVPVNCGAIPETLIDSQLFGHTKGAFSGADAAHLGLVRAAAGGTLLLDEVGDLPMSAQARLLRLLEEREVQPVGQARPVVVDVRIIAATNGCLADAVRAGRFRQDLFFRLDVVRVDLQPLRDRRHEILPLFDMFNAEFAVACRRPEVMLTHAARLALERHAWRGNVRELRTVVERLHVLCDPTDALLDVADLSRFGQLDLSCQAFTRSPTNRFACMRLDAVNDAIGSCNGNMSRAAHALGVHRSTLYRWLAERRLSA